MTRIALVVPCYNESARMRPGAWLAFLRRPDSAGVHFFFADDGSTDGTRRMLEDLCAQGERTHLLAGEVRRGKGEVVRRSMLKILADGAASFDYVGFWDADLSTPLGEIRRIRHLLREHPFDGVFCSRVKRLGATVERTPLRHVAGRVFATAASLMLDLPVYDTQCGAKVFRTGQLREVMQEPFVSSWIFDVEIILRMKQRGLTRLHEMPVEAWTDRQGSKLRGGDIIRVPVELLKIHRRYR